MDILDIGFSVDSDPLKRANEELDQFAAKGGKASKASSDFSKSNNQLSSSLTVVRNAVAGLAAYMGVREIISYADAWKSVNNQLTAVYGSAQQAIAIQRELLDLAQRTRTGFAGVAALYGRLAITSTDLGATQQELMKFTEGVGQALAIQGTSATQARGALLQLSQAIGGGIVRAEEFNSLLENGIVILQTVAKNMGQTGVSVAELRSRVIAGTVTSEEFFRAFLEGSDELQTKFERTSATIGQALTQLRNSMILAIGTFDDTVGASTALADAVSFVAANLDNLAIVVGVTLVASFRLALPLVDLMTAAMLRLSRTPAALAITGISVALITMKEVMDSFGNDMVIIGNEATTVGEATAAAWGNVMAVLKADGEIASGVLFSILQSGMLLASVLTGNADAAEYWAARTNESFDSVADGYSDLVGTFQDAPFEALLPDMEGITAFIADLQRQLDAKIFSDYVAGLSTVEINTANLLKTTLSYGTALSLIQGLVEDGSTELSLYNELVGDVDVALELLATNGVLLTREQIEALNKALAELRPELELLGSIAVTTTRNTETVVDFNTAQTLFNNLIEKGTTASERYRATTKSVEQALIIMRNNGVEPTERQLRALNRALAELDPVAIAAQEALEKSAKEIQNIYDRAADGIQSAFADAFENIIRNGELSFKSLGNAILSIMISVASQIAAAQLFSNIGFSAAGASGGGGVAGAAGTAGSAINGITGIGGAIAGGSLFTGSAAATTAVYSATGSIGAATAANTLTSVAGLGAAIGGYLLSSVLFKPRQGPGNEIGGTIGAIGGAAIGGPLGAFIGSFIGATIGGLFGATPSDRLEGNNVNLQTGQITPGDLGPGKDSPENREAADALTNALVGFNQQLISITGGTSTAQNLLVEAGTLGSPFRGSVDGERQNFDSAEAAFGALAGDLVDSLQNVGPIVKRALEVLDFSYENAESAMGLLAFAKEVETFLNDNTDNPTFSIIGEQFAALDLQLETFRANLEAIGQSADLANPIIEKLRQEIVDNFVGGLEKTINELSGLGFVNELRSLVDTVKQLRLEAGEAGAGGAEVEQVFALGAKKIIDNVVRGDNAESNLNLIKVLFGDFPDIVAAANEALTELANGITDAVDSSAELVSMQQEQLKVTTEQVKALQAVSDAIRQSITDARINPNLSPFGPSGRLNEAQSAFDSVLAAARGGDLDAAGQLPSARNALLEAARTMFASGSGYTDVFFRTEQQLEGIAETAETELSLLQQQVTLLEQQLGILNVIAGGGLPTAANSNAIAGAPGGTAAGAEANYNAYKALLPSQGFTGKLENTVGYKNYQDSLAALGVNSQMAVGGLGTGDLTLVGENGPEVMRMPGGARVFANGTPMGGEEGLVVQEATLSVTREGFNALLTEVKRLNGEVSRLRKDVRQQARAA